MELSINNEDSSKKQFLCFNIGSKPFAIQLDKTKEVIHLNQEIVKLPNVAKQVKGIINFKGRVLAVLDLTAIFPKKEFRKMNYRHILLVEANKKEAGILIDDIPNIFQIDDDKIEQAQKETNEFIIGKFKIENSLFSTIDIEKILELPVTA